MVATIHRHPLRHSGSLTFEITKPSSQPTPLTAPLAPLPSWLRMHRPVQTVNSTNVSFTDLVRESPAVRGVILGAGGVASLIGVVNTAEAAPRVETPQVQPNAIRGIVFVGMNPTGSYEVEQLRSRVGDSGVTYVAPSKNQDEIKVRGTTYNLTTDEGRLGFAQTIGLTGDRADALAEVLKGVNDNARDELAQLAQLFRQSEKGERVIDRLILSGHSVGSGVWGDHNGSLSFDSLGKLALIFPRAAAQVEDLMLAACYTGGEHTMNTYTSMFPNLKTVWAYNGSAPGAWSGAIPHLTRWERATRGNATTIDRDLAKHTRKGENVATWSITQGYNNGTERRPLAEDRASYDTSAPIVANYLSGEAVVENPQTGPLRDHYNAIQRLLSRPDLPADQRPALQKERDQVIRLLFWDNIRVMFTTMYGNDVRAAYQAVGLDAPDFSKLTRIEAIEKITLLETKISETPGASNSTRATATRLRESLIELSPARIPASWI